jgi:hypothetical protein
MINLKIVKQKKLSHEYIHISTDIISRWCASSGRTLAKSGIDIKQIKFPEILSAVHEGRQFPKGKGKILIHYRQWA